MTGEIVHVTLMSADFDTGLITAKVDGDMPVFRRRQYALVDAADLIRMLQLNADMGKTITEQKQRLAVYEETA